MKQRGIRRSTYRRNGVAGVISSAGFKDGHRFVIGCWERSPIGPICDVMWATPDDHRVLLVAEQAAADFITSIYEFDEIRVGPLTVASDHRHTIVSGHGLDMELVGGRRRPVPFPRPLAITRFVEAPIARKLMGVETYGTSLKGAREWYQTRGWRWVVDGRCLLDGIDLGRPVPIERRIGVGFSEPPPRPSIVSVHVAIDLRRL